MFLKVTGRIMRSLRELLEISQVLAGLLRYITDYNVVWAGGSPPVRGFLFHNGIIR